MSAPGPAGERQEHLDATVSFAGAGQRRLFLRGLDILTIKWTTGDLPEECRFLLDTQLMFLKDKGPDLEAVRRRRVDSFVDGSARCHN